MKRDLYNNVKTVSALKPKSLTASTSGAVIDLKGFQSVDFAVHVGDYLDAAGSVSVSLHECATAGGAFTPVVADDILGSLPVFTSGTASGTVSEFGYRGGLEFVKTVATVSGIVSGVAIGAVAIKSHADVRSTRMG